MPLVRRKLVRVVHLRSLRDVRVSLATHKILLRAKVRYKLHVSSIVCGYRLGVGARLGLWYALIGLGFWVAHLRVFE